MRRQAALVAAVLLVLTACADDVRDGDAEPGPTVTTPRVTATGTVTEGVRTTPSPGAGTDGTVRGDQAYILAPQEPVTTRPSDPHDEGGEGIREFGVIGRRDGELPSTLDVTFFPCRNVRFGSGAVIFADDDGDGLADDIGRSDRGAAFVFSINGVRYEVEGDNIVTDVDVEDGRVRFSLNAEMADCAVPVAWTDRDHDLQLDLGRDPEPFSAGRITWRR